MAKGLKLGGVCGIMMSVKYFDKMRKVEKMKKERFEWVKVWCDEAHLDDLPRVLLVGDSITEGYQGFVRESLREVCYVDFIATSYAVDNKLYHTLVEGLVKNSRYDLVHFNHGLHGIHMSPRTYKSKVRKICEKIRAESKLVLAESSVVYTEGNKRLHREWKKRLAERNAVLAELATEFDCPLDRLFAVSEAIPKESRSRDGVHYLESSYKEFAAEVVKCVRSALKI